MFETPKFYTGIGSRETPQPILNLMRQIAENLGEDYILRSGGAGGADEAFEAGCDRVGGLKHIYLPWPGFKGSRARFRGIPPECFDLAQRIHPAWDRLTAVDRKLHARNTQQVLGDRPISDPKPSSFLICWTRNGQPIGGTRTAIELALRHGIPVFNLFDTAQRQHWEQVLSYA